MRGDLSSRLLLILIAYCLGTNVAELQLKTLNFGLLIAIQFGIIFGQRRTTISFVMSVRMSERNNSAVTGRIFIKLALAYFSKICRENSSLIKMWQEQGRLYMKTYANS
jgi:hypothetical protein